jgi:uncharacterized membrane protein YphA (DoxX/SURF4 family)
MGEADGVLAGLRRVKMAGTPANAGRCVPAWPKDALRISFGIIWLIDALLKWLPGFKDSYMSTIMGIKAGQPGWLQPWFQFWISLQHPAVTFFRALVATAETLIALALIFGFARKLTYCAAIVFSLLIWSTAQGFGGPYISWWWRIAEMRRLVPAYAAAAAGDVPLSVPAQTPAPDDGPASHPTPA